MINKVMNAPINLFFDVTPIGKLLNRFSRDMSMLDDDINYSIGSFMVYFYGAIMSLAVAVYAVPMIILIEAVYLWCIIHLFRRVLPAYKECFRINMIQFSPIISFFQETISGNTVIRAFGKEETSCDRALHMLDNNCLSNTITSAVWAWYAIRVELLSMLVLAAGCFAAIWFRTTVDPVLLALMLQYLLTLQDMCNWGLYSIGEIERKMVCIQRLFALEDVPQEATDSTARPEGKSWPSQG